MKAFKTFQRALIHNYYQDFLIEEDYDQPYDDGFFFMVNYQGKPYLEIDPREVLSKQKGIFDKIRDLSAYALSEINLEISSKSKEAANRQIFAYIQSLQVVHQTLSRDFNTHHPSSRYYTTPNQNDEIMGAQFILNKLQQDIDFEIPEDLYHSTDSLTFEILNLRLETFITLIRNLILITENFIYRLETLKNDLNNLQSNLESEKKLSGGSLSANQFVLMLDNFGFFSHLNFDKSSVAQKAKIVEMLSGNHYKNLEKRISNLENKPSKNGEKYMKDFNTVQSKIDSILK